MFHEIYVMRHGQTIWNAEGRMQGAFNSPLTELGRRQAAAQGALLDPLDLEGFDAFSSPQGRCFETAGHAVAGKMGRVCTDDRLCEIRVGEWSGRLRSEFAASGQFRPTPDGEIELYERAPGGEGFDALEARCRAFLADLQRPAVIVTHGITSRMLRSIVLGLGRQGLDDMEGGQGVIFHLKNGVQTRLG